MMQAKLKFLSIMLFCTLCMQALLSFWSMPAVASVPVLQTASQDKIAFVRCEPPQEGYSKCNLWIMNPDGSDQTQVTSGIQVQFRPSWSPDGKEIAFSSHDDSKIHIVNLETGDVRQLPGKTGCWDFDPDWSPDGKVIASSYQCGNIGGFSPSGVAYISPDADTSFEVFLQRSSFPVWSPDGTKIAVNRGFVEPGEGDPGLYIYDRDGTNPIKLTDQTGSYPSWSPDGKWIAQTVDGIITLFPLDGGEPVALISGVSPAWSPDGSQLAFSDGSNIMIVNLEDGQVRDVAKGEFPAWYRPAAARLSSPPPQEAVERLRQPEELLQQAKQLLLDGHGGQALDALEQSLALSRQNSDPVGESASLSLIGQVYSSWGEYEQALDYYRSALPVAQAAGDAHAQLEALKGMSVTLDTLGQYDQALRTYREALSLSSQVKAPYAQGEILIETANLLTQSGAYQEAAEMYQDAHDTARRIQDKVLEGEALLGLGILYIAQGQPSQSLDYLKQAKELFVGGTNDRMVAETLYYIGLAHEVSEAYKNALTYYEQALEIYRKSGLYMPYEEMITRAAIGRVYFAQGRYRDAYSASFGAINSLEHLRSEIHVAEFRLSFMDVINTSTSIYDTAVLSSFELGNYSEAFAYAEQSRARVLLDQLAVGPIRLDHLEVSQDLLSQQQSLRRQMADLQHQLFSLNSAPLHQRDEAKLAEIRDRLIDLEDKYANLLIQIWRQDPRYARGAYNEVSSLEEVQGLLRGGITLIEYFVTQDRTLAFIVTRDSFETVALQPTHEDLVETITTFRDFASLGDPHPASLRQLHEWLIAPLKSYLTTPVIGIVPHGVLHYLPFAALTDGERYMSDDYVLFTLPSASALRFIQEKRKPQIDTLLALGNPTITAPLPSLHFAEQEVEAVADLYGIQPLVGAEATESAVWSQAGQAGVLHLAAHGEYNPFNPLFSAIYLAGDAQNDGRLEVHEVYELDLRAATDLVVLSACQTQIGELSAGDEVVGLNRAFLYAGAPSVVASLWSVDDAATALLMERFYTHLRAGMGKAEALRWAQIEVRGKYPHPYYWAAFVLTGDPGEVTGEVAISDATPVAEATEDVASQPTSETGGRTLCASAALPLGLVVVTVIRRTHMVRRQS